MTAHLVPHALGMSENDLLAAVRHLAAYKGWLAYHTHRSERSEPGFPDLCMVKGARVIFAELKSQKGRVSGPQQEWLDALRLAPVEVYLWRPADLLDGTVQGLLSLSPPPHR